MKKLFLLLSAASLLFAVSSCSEESVYEVDFNNQINAIVDGYVFEGDNTTDIPLEGVVVTISGQTSTTDAGGYFSIDGLAPGDYIVTYEKEGYTTIMYYANIDGYDYNGDAIQTFVSQDLYPDTHTLTVNFLKWDADDSEYDAVNVELNVEIDYASSSILDDIDDQLTSAGSFTLSSIPAVALSISIPDQLVGDNKYSLAKMTVAGTYVEEGVVNIAIDVVEDYESGDVDY